jgi:hypothetical protein
MNLPGQHRGEKAGVLAVEDEISAQNADVRRTILPAMANLFRSHRGRQMWGDAFWNNGLKSGHREAGVVGSGTKSRRGAHAAYRDLASRILATDADD